jgi:hypothetical protein
MKFIFQFSAFVFLPFALSSLCAREELPLMNPISEPVEYGDLTLHLEHWLTLPATSDKSPKARINTMISPRDGSRRIFINDLRGPLYVVVEDNYRTYLDLPDHLPGFYDKRGLGGGFNFFTFHPDFAVNGLFYTVHSEEPGVKVPDFIGPTHKDVRPLDSIILEWKATDPSASPFEGNYREIMRVSFPGQIHTLQDMVFDPYAKPGDVDYGLLYIGVGEGGATESGQSDSLSRLDSLLGTIVRIDPFGTNSANGNYGIPNTNPYANDGDDNTFGEIWAIGFRNPHRFAWDTEGRLLATDIGKTNVEEINIIEPARNYGWPYREGTFEIQLDRNKFGLLPLSKDDNGYTYPAAQFDHMDGSAILGGYVYTGNNHPLLLGKYVFGEILRGHMFYTEVAELQFGKLATIKKFRVTHQGQETTMQKLAGKGRTDLRIGIDPDNELYLMEKAQGRIYKIASVNQK